VHLGNGQVERVELLLGLLLRIANHVGQTRNNFLHAFHTANIVSLYKLKLMLNKISVKRRHKMIIF